MQTNKTKRLVTADENKWLTLDNIIFVKSLYLAQLLDFSVVIEVSDEEKQNLENELLTL